MMRKHQVDTTRVDVEGVAKVALAHRRALDVPARPALSERRVPRGPDLLVTRLRLLPQREVADRLLVVLVSGHAGTGAKPLPVEVRQLAVVRKAGDAEIHVAVRGVRV